MRSLFGSGPNGFQFGYDFASLEARIQGHYCWKYTDGQSLAATLLAEKPLDIHTITGLKLGVPRTDAKSINYALIYGAAWPKLMAMLACGADRAKEVFNAFWDSVPALKELKAAVEAYWISTGKKFIIGIDGRRINIRSQHSILNALFQSAGVIAAKYVNVLSYQKFESQGHCINPFVGVPDICNMIEYHDECQIYSSRASKLITFKVFDSETEAKEFLETLPKDGYQWSALSEGKKWYVCDPNVISKAIEDSMKEVKTLLKLNVDLGYEWIVNTTWYGCH